MCWTYLRRIIGPNSHHKRTELCCRWYSVGIHQNENYLTGFWNSARYTLYLMMMFLLNSSGLFDRSLSTCQCRERLQTWAEPGWAKLVNWALLLWRTPHIIPPLRRVAKSSSSYSSERNTWCQSTRTVKLQRQDNEVAKTVRTFLHKAAMVLNLDITTRK